MSRFQRTLRDELRRRKVLVRWLLRIGGALALGSLCPLLPEHYQLPCHIGARLLTLLGGGS